MIFQRTYKQVLNGSKRQTRRLVKPGDVHIKDGDYEHQAALGIGAAVTGEGKRGRRIRWAVNMEYAVQPGRNEKSVGRIRITGIRQERLQDISDRDAVREGVIYDVGPANREGYIGPRMAFQFLWDRIYVGQPDKQWSSNPIVWVLDFELVKESAQ